MADIDLSFGADLAPLLDNFVKLTNAAKQTGESVKATGKAIQDDSRKSAASVDLINKAYKNTADGIALVNSVGLEDFTLSIDKGNDALITGVGITSEMQEAADKLVASLLGTGDASVLSATKIIDSISKEATALANLLELRLQATNPSEQKQLNVEIAKQVALIESLKKEYAKLNELPPPSQDQTEGFSRLQVQIIAAEKEAQRLGEQYGTLDERFIEAAKAAAELKAELKNVKAAIAAQNPEEKFKAFETAVGGVIGSLQTVTGAMQVFGGESEKVQQIALKLQGLFNFAQGVNTLFTLKDSFNNLLAVLGLVRNATALTTVATVAQGTATTVTTGAIVAEGVALEGAAVAQKQFNLAALANPYVAIAAALVAITAALYIYYTASEDAAEIQEKINDATELQITALQRLQEEIDVTTKIRQSAFKAEIDAANAANISLRERQSLERKLAQERVDSAQDAAKKNAQGIKDLDALKVRSIVLVEVVKQLKKEGKDEDLIKQKERELELTDQQIKNIQGVIDALLDAKNAQGLLNLEIQNQNDANELEQARGFIKARLAEARTGTSMELKAKLDAINLEQAAQIRALNNDKDREGERLAILAESNKKRLEAENDYLLARLKNKETADKIILLKTRENSAAELEARVSILEDERNIELSQLNITEQEKLKIRLETERKISELRKDFALKEIQRAITFEQTNAQLRLTLSQEFSIQQLQAQKDLITAKEELDITSVRFSLKSEKEKEALINLIVAQAIKDREVLTRASVQRELDYELKFAKQASDIKIAELQRQIDSEFTGSLTKRKLKQDQFDELIAQNNREFAANKDAYANGIISLEEYLLQRKRLIAEGVGLTAAKDIDAKSPDESFFATLGFDLSPAQEEAINQSFAYATNAFSSFVDARQGEIDRLKAQNDELIASIDQSIQATSEAITQEVELAKIGYANNVDEKKKELEALKTQRKAALENEKQIAKEQDRLNRAKIISDSLVQISSLITAGALLVAAEASKGLIGVVLAFGGLALILSTFARFRGQAESLGDGGTLDLHRHTTRRDSGTLKGRSHADKGGMRIEGTNIYVEGDEEIINKRVSRKRRKLLKAINNDNFSSLNYNDVQDIIAGIGIKINPDVANEINNDRSSINTFNSSNIIKMETAELSKELKAVREEVKGLRKDQTNKKEITYYPDGSYSEKSGNSINIFRKV